MIPCQTVIGILQHGFQTKHAGIQCSGKGRFFGLECLLDQCTLGDQFRIGISHHFDQWLKHAPKQSVGTQGAQLPNMAYSPSDNPTQHIAAAFIRRQYAIDNKKGTGADMIGDDTQ